MDVVTQKIRKSQIRRHLVGVWIGGVWNGHFPESKKNIFQSPNYPGKSLNSAERAIFAKFQAPKYENSEPKKCNSIPLAIPYPH